MSKTLMIRHLPPGFTDRWMHGPCNRECLHPECPVMRAELRAYGIKRALQFAGHVKRKAMLR